MIRENIEQQQVHQEIVKKVAIDLSEHFFVAYQDLNVTRFYRAAFALNFILIKNWLAFKLEDYNPDLLCSNAFAGDQ